MKREIFFVRQDRNGIDAMAVMSLTLAKEMTDDEAVEAVKAGVTEWIKETEEGKLAWARSSEDLNVGDLINEFTSKLPGFLERHDVLSMKLTSFNAGSFCYYDTVLVNRGALEDTFESGS